MGRVTAARHAIVRSSSGGSTGRLHARSDALSERTQSDPEEGRVEDPANRGGIAALTAQAVQLVLYTGTAIALARMLTPEDHGVFGITLASSRSWGSLSMPA